MDSVGQCYGEALFSLAKQENKIKEFYEQLNILDQVFTKDLIRYLTSVDLSKLKQKEILASVLEKQVDTYILHFLYVCIDNKRLNHIHDIVLSFNQSYYQDQNILLGDLISARLFDQKQITDIEQALKKSLGSDIHLDNKIDTTLIGGFKVDIDGKLYDYSLKHQLNKLKDDLKKGVYK